MLARLSWALVLPVERGDAGWPSRGAMDPAQSSHLIPAVRLGATSGELMGRDQKLHLLLHRPHRRTPLEDIMIRFYSLDHVIVIPSAAVNQN